MAASTGDQLRQAVARKRMTHEPSLCGEDYYLLELFELAIASELDPLTHEACTNVE